MGKEKISRQKAETQLYKYDLVIGLESLEGPLLTDKHPKILLPEDLGAKEGRMGNKTEVSLIKPCSDYFLQSIEGGIMIFI